MHDSNISIEDLLTDENFIKWAKHPDHERDLYWKSWLEAHPERKYDVLLAREIILRSKFRHTAPSQEAYTEVLHRLMKDANHTQPSYEYAGSGKKNWDYRIRVAATLVLLALLSGLIMWWQYEPPVPRPQASLPAWVTKQNPAGLKSQLQLPDGSMVWLNAESILKYPTAFDSISRHVELIGEAFFDVAEDMQRPFTVHSGNLSTTALGTSFNVSSYPKAEAIEISLVTGKVVISKTKTDTLEKIVLDPGEQIIYMEHSQGFIKTKFDYDTSLGWKEGLLVFKESDILQIKRKLERWYGVNIELKGIPKQGWKITGTFKNQSLERVLERLSFSKDFTFQISDKNVVMNFTNQKLQ